MILFLPLQSSATSAITIAPVGQSHQLGSTIVILGTLSFQNNLLLGTDTPRGLPVTVELYDPSGNVIDAKTIPIENDQFRYLIETGQGNKVDQGGKFTVIAYYGNPNPVLLNTPQSAEVSFNISSALPAVQQPKATAESMPSANPQGYAGSHYSQSSQSVTNSPPITVQNSIVWVVVGIIILAIIAGIAKSSTSRRAPSELENALSNNFRDWDSRKFEELVADLYSKKGYRTRLTPEGPDQGIDVIAEKGRERIVIQAKCWKNNVSNTDVLKTAGARQMAKATKAVVITNSDFTSSAREAAKNIPDLELIDMDKLHDEIRKSFKIK